MYGAYRVEGSARMLNNDALDDDEVAEGLGADVPVPADQPISPGGLRVTGGGSMSRVAVVTGGASGMGEATCHELGRRGHKVAVLDLNGEAAQRVAEDLRAEGVTALGCRRRRQRPRGRRGGVRQGAHRARARCTSWSPAPGWWTSRRSPTSPPQAWAAADRRQPDRHLPLLSGRACPTCSTRAGAAS